MQFRLMTPAVLAVACAAWSPVQAQLLSSGLACGGATLDAAFSPTPLACSGAWVGNDANQQSDLLAQLETDFVSVVGAGSTYTFLGKSDDAGSGPFTFNPSDLTSGTLTFDQAQTGYFAVSLKAGNAFSVYLFDGAQAGVESIEFSTLGIQVNQNGNPAGLSHAALIGITPIPEPGVSPIPEPGTYALMALGLAAVGGAVRRREKRR